MYSDGGFPVNTLSIKNGKSLFKTTDTAVCRVTFD